MSLFGLKLNIGPGLQIEIPDGFCRETLEQVLETLKVLRWTCYQIPNICLPSAVGNVPSLRFCTGIRTVFSCGRNGLKRTGLNGLTPKVLDISTQELSRLIALESVPNPFLKRCGLFDAYQEMIFFLVFKGVKIGHWQGVNFERWLTGVWKSDRWIA